MSAAAGAAKTAVKKGGYAAAFEAYALERGAWRARVFDAKKVAVDERVRLKCEIPLCPHYGHCLTCPPNAPSVEDFRRILKKHEGRGDQAAQDRQRGRRQGDGDGLSLRHRAYWRRVHVVRGMRGRQIRRKVPVALPGAAVHGGGGHRRAYHQRPGGPGVCAAAGKGDHLDRRRAAGMTARNGRIGSQTWSLGRVTSFRRGYLWQR
ncbi:MAG: hypothetical protein HY804_02510 [Nitrospinae bacterium]|nr:hypothetical protein [Nitrospinota bacterium]